MAGAWGDNRSAAVQIQRMLSSTPSIVFAKGSP